MLIIDTVLEKSFGINYFSINSLQTFTSTLNNLILNTPQEEGKEEEAEEEEEKKRKQTEHIHRHNVIAHPPTP